MDEILRRISSTDVMCKEEENMSCGRGGRIDFGNDGDTEPS